MKYISTRGAAPVLSFEEAMLTGLARDGGLYLPETLDPISPKTLNSWKRRVLSCAAFCAHISVFLWSVSGRTG